MAQSHGRLWAGFVNHVATIGRYQAWANFGLRLFGGNSGKLLANVAAGPRTPGLHVLMEGEEWRNKLVLIEGRGFANLVTVPSSAAVR